MFMYGEITIPVVSAKLADNGGELAEITGSANIEHQAAVADPLLAVPALVHRFPHVGLRDRGQPNLADGLLGVPRGLQQPVHDLRLVSAQFDS